jgi:hypothetical protein
MEDIRGTILLCDQLYPTVNGKYVISGTYTNFFTVLDELTISNGINAYLRVQVEHAGQYQFKVLAIDRAQASNATPLFEVQGEVVVRDPLEPLEAGLLLPGFTVKCPVGSTVNIEIGKPVGANLLIWLEINGKAIASSPLRIIFRNPRDPQHAISFNVPPTPGSNPRSGQ